MKLDPFIQVDDVPFTTSRDELVATLGRPLWTARNGVGLNELDYGDCVYRFQESGRLEEVTKRADVVHFREVAVPFASLKAFVVAQDTSAFERAGFVVSPKYGLAFAPESPDWVTALARHCIGSWRAL
jgi:hypothetical protein